MHGHNNVVGATIFPHNIGLGATRDPALVQQIGRATAEEVSGTGIDWDFSPCLCVARNDRWGRTYESFGEKPELATSMATYITGLQGSSLSASGSVLATAKHFIGDGGTTNGTDQGNTQITEAELRAIHLPPFAEAVRRGVGSVMISYNSWNGVKDHGNQYLITTLLKGELGFTGFVVSDWNGIDQIDGQAGFTAAEVTQSINAGIDMVMVPTAWQQFITTLRGEVQAGHIPMSRIDDANRRILTKKFELGLFERPLTDRSYTPTVGNAAHRAIARQAVRESQVLLKNAGNVLPLAKTNNKIFVAGKNADNIGNQSGGWTISWQGGSGAVTTGTTILQGIRAAVGTGTTVTYNQNGTGIDSSYRVAVAVVGETPYAEGAGDRPERRWAWTPPTSAPSARCARPGCRWWSCWSPGDRSTSPPQLPNWNALLASWLPGTEGNGVADVLFGDYAPTGKLPSTWMQSASQQPINDGDGKPALFPYGFGLTYGSRHDPQRVRRDPGGELHHAVRYADRDHDRHRRRQRRRLHHGRRLARLQQRRLRYGGRRLRHHPPRLRRHRHRHRPVPAGQHDRTGDRDRAGQQHRRLADLDQPRPPTCRPPRPASTPSYVTFTTNGTGDLVNLNWFQFAQSGSRRTPTSNGRRRATRRSPARRPRRRRTPAAG